MSPDVERLWRWRAELKMVHRGPAAYRPRCVGVVAPWPQPQSIYLSIYLNPAPAQIMNAPMGEWRYSTTYVNFSTRLRCIVCFLFQLLYLLGKNLVTKWIGGKWAPKTVCMFGIRKKSLVPAKFTTKDSTFHSPDSIPTMLSWQFTHIRKFLAKTENKLNCTLQTLC
jgi:hypothetical protein